MRIVFDTNVLISASLFKNSIPNKVVCFARTRAIVMFSKETRQEILLNISSKKFDRYTSTEERDVFLKALLKVAEFIMVTEKITDCRDSKDNKFLELAVCGEADYLVSGDKDLLVLNPFREIPILSANEFLERIKLEQTASTESSV